ncbi:hypothetical protein Tco_1257586, partial [Tanacetum coccineum]
MASSKLRIERSPIRAAALAFAVTEAFFRKSTRSTLEDLLVQYLSPMKYKPSYANGNGRSDYDSRSVRILSPPPEPSATPPHPKSYMD